MGRLGGGSSRKSLKPKARFCGGVSGQICARIADTGKCHLNAQMSCHQPQQDDACGGCRAAASERLQRCEITTIFDDQITTSCDRLNSEPEAYRSAFLALPLDFNHPDSYCSSHHHGPYLMQAAYARRYPPACAYPASTTFNLSNGPPTRKSHSSNAKSASRLGMVL
jgi:hypothetical protein